MILGFDTSTPATAVALAAGEQTVVEVRDDPAPGSRPHHAERLLELVEEAMSAAGAGWEEIDRIAVGVGPGGFTGLRIGIATARGLALSSGIPLVPVGSLHALALGADRVGGTPPAGANRLGGSAIPILAVLDARRGEAFAAAFADGGRGMEIAAPAALAPPALADLARRLVPAPLAVGDGSVRFRSELEAAGAIVPPDGSALHRVSASAICRLGAQMTPSGRSAVLPDYRRSPDAKRRSAATP